MQPKPPRPTGVTIIGILGILAGLALLGLAFVGAAVVAVFTGAAGLAAVVGGIIAILGLIQLGVAIAFFSGKGWAWTLGMVLQVIILIFNILSLPVSILGLIINVIILYYLTRPHVKAFFGKGPMMGPTMSSGMMGTPMGPSSTGPSQSSSMIRCANCGAMSQAGTMKCSSCGAPL